MSEYYSRFGLNTYSGTPYFQSQMPDGYPINAVLQKLHTFRRLPPNFIQLAGLAKRWAARVQPSLVEQTREYYDGQGFELDPATGHRLTDEEIDAQWQPDPSLDKLVVEDIPVPPGGFADPDTWEEPKVEHPYQVDVPTKEQLLKDIADRGRQRTSEEYGIPVDQLPYA